MEISEKPITLEGQLLRPPTIYYGKKQMAASSFSSCIALFGEFLFLPQDVNNGAWNITRQHLHSPEIIRAWAVVDYSLRLDQRKAQAFMETLEQCCTARGKVVRSSYC